MFTINSNGSSILLRSPNTGNTDDNDLYSLEIQAANNMKRRFRSPLWPAIVNKSFTVYVASQDATYSSCETVLTFLTINIGQLATFTDHASRVFEGVIQPKVIAEPYRHGFVLTFNAMCQYLGAELFNDPLFSDPEEWTGWPDSNNPTPYETLAPASQPTLQTGLQYRVEVKVVSLTGLILQVVNNSQTLVWITSATTAKINFINASNTTTLAIRAWFLQPSASAELEYFGIRRVGL